MSNLIIKNKKINNFNCKISVPGDKSLSIRWVLFSSISDGECKAKNLLMSEDVITALDAIQKLGIKVKINKNFCSIKGNGLFGYKYKKNIVLNANNSGTLGRLILGLLIDTPYTIKIIGDKSLSKRDFQRISDPLSKFGAKFKLKKNKNLPLYILGSNNLKPIKYYEQRGSAQCKSSIILASLKTRGETIIKAKKSRNHTELLCKHFNLPIKIKKFNNSDLIKINNKNKPLKIKSFNYEIPGDISSASFFLILTALNKNSKLVIKNVNINNSRIGVIKILKMMGVKIKFLNKKTYKGEKISDIFVEGCKKIKPIKCPTKFNSGAIDEFLTIFLLAAKANGISYFNNLQELNQKESPRLYWGSKILNKIGIKNEVTKKSIKIFGNPKLQVNKKILIENYLKDHRVFMTSVIAALSFGGQWLIKDKNSVNTSFPTFLKIVRSLINDKK
jgi:3-phosphoshikimate 1-carboxyvinyltransferase